MTALWGSVQVFSFFKYLLLSIYWLSQSRRYHWLSDAFLHLMQAYSNNLVDHHIILDLLPSLAQAYFSNHIPANLSYLQAAILLSLGLQQNDISSLESAIQLPPNQALALFNKVTLLATSQAYTADVGLSCCIQTHPWEEVQLRNPECTHV